MAHSDLGQIASKKKRMDLFQKYIKQNIYSRWASLALKNVYTYKFTPTLGIQIIYVVKIINFLAVTKSTHLSVLPMVFATLILDKPINITCYMNHGEYPS